MGIIDDVIGAFADLVDFLLTPVGFGEVLFDQDARPQDIREDTAELFGQGLEDVSPIDEVLENIIEAIEESVIAPLDEKGQLNPEDVEDEINDVEGNAAQILAAFGSVGAGLEALGVGQMETPQEAILQTLAGLGVDDVTGFELDARLQEGVEPALNAWAGKRHRSKFVNLPDAVEYALRNKERDSGYLRASGATEDVIDVVGSDEPINRNNLVEEWGIRDDQLQILEEVSLEAMEFEELIETPAELGLTVDEEVLDVVLDLAGYPEPLKDFLRQVPQEIPRSNRLWEERTAVEPVVSELETLAGDEEIDPQAAVDLLPEAVAEAKPALRDRFANLQDVPPGAPTRSLVEGSFASGYTDLETLRARLERLEYDTEGYEDVLRKQVLDELDGDLQEAVALGLLSPGEYADLAEFAGLEDETIDLLLRGQSFSDISSRRLQEEADPASLSVRTLSGIGESRAAGLQANGIETVGDMAGASVEQVTEATQIAPETAESFIQQASQRLT